MPLYATDFPPFVARRVGSMETMDTPLPESDLGRRRASLTVEELEEMIDEADREVEMLEEMILESLRIMKKTKR